MQIASLKDFNKLSLKLTERESKVGEGRVALTLHILHICHMSTELITSQTLFARRRVDFDQATHAID